MTPLDRLILASVKCIDCGAGFGQCGCAERRKAENDAKKKAFIAADVERMMALSPEEFEAECKALGVWPFEQ